MKSDQINLNIARTIGGPGKPSMHEIREEDEEHKSSSSCDRNTPKDNLFTVEPPQSRLNSELVGPESSRLSEEPLSSPKISLEAPRNPHQNETLFLSKKNNLIFSNDSNTFVKSENDNILRLTQRPETVQSGEFGNFQLKQMANEMNSKGHTLSKSHPGQQARPKEGELKGTQDAQGGLSKTLEFNNQSLKFNTYNNYSKQDTGTRKQNSLLKMYNYSNRSPAKKTGKSTLSPFNFTFQPKTNFMKMPTVNKNRMDQGQRHHSATLHAKPDLAGDFQIGKNLTNIFQGEFDRLQKMNLKENLDSGNQASPVEKDPVRAELINLENRDFSLGKLGEMYGNMQNPSKHHINQINVVNNISQSVINFPEKKGLGGFDKNPRAQEKPGGRCKSFQKRADRDKFDLADSEFRLNKFLFNLKNEEGSDKKHTESSKYFSREEDDKVVVSDHFFQLESQSNKKQSFSARKSKSNRSVPVSNVQMSRMMDGFGRIEKELRLGKQSQKLKNSPLSEKSIFVSKSNKKSKKKIHKAGTSESQRLRISAKADDENYCQENYLFDCKEPKSSIQNAFMEKFRFQNDSCGALYNEFKSKNGSGGMKGTQIQKIVSNQMKKMLQMGYHDRQSRSAKAHSLENPKRAKAGRRRLKGISSRKKPIRPNMSYVQARNKKRELKRKQKRITSKKNIKHSNSAEIDLKSLGVRNERFFQTANLDRPKQSCDAKVSNSLEKNEPVERESDDLLEFNSNNFVKLETIERVKKSKRSFSNNSIVKATSFEKYKKSKLTVDSKKKRNFIRNHLRPRNYVNSMQRDSKGDSKKDAWKRPAKPKKSKMAKNSGFPFKRYLKQKMRTEDLFTKKYSKDIHS